MTVMRVFRATEQSNIFQNLKSRVLTGMRNSETQEGYLLIRKRGLITELMF